MKTIEVNNQPRVAASVEDKLVDSKKSELTTEQIKDLEDLLLRWQDARDVEDTVEADLKKLKSARYQIEVELVAKMRGCGLKNFRNHRGRISITPKYSMSTPKGEDIAAFREWCEKQGVYEHQWLQVKPAFIQQFYADKYEESAKEGKLFEGIPGTGAVSHYYSTTRGK